VALPLTWNGGARSVCSSNQCHGLASLWNDGVLDDKLDPDSDRAFLERFNLPTG